MGEIMSHTKDVIQMLPWIPGRTLFPFRQRHCCMKEHHLRKERKSPPACQWAGAILQCCTTASEQRWAKELPHGHVSAGEDTNTERQKGEMNAGGTLVLSLKHGVYEHATDLLCHSSEEDACISQGQGMALWQVNVQVYLYVEGK